MNQHTYVQHCYQRYAELDLQPGNPEDGRWEKAHYPVPKCLGGTEWVWLHRQDHFVQGLLQSREFDHICFLVGTTKAFLKNNWSPDWFNLLDVYDALVSARNKSAAMRAAARAANLGRKQTDAQLRLFRENNPGKTERSRQLHSDRLLGTKFPESVCKKMSKSSSLRWIDLLNGYVSTRSHVSRRRNDAGIDPNKETAQLPQALLEHTSDDRNTNLAVWTAYQQNPGLL